MREGLLNNQMGSVPEGTEGGQGSGSSRSRGKVDGATEGDEDNGHPQLVARDENKYPAKNIVSISALESLDFDMVNNPYWTDVARRPPRSLVGYTGRTFARWSLVIIIGFCVAVAGSFVSFSITHVSNTRNQVLQNLLDNDQPDKYAFFFFLLYNAALCLVGCLLTVLVEPSAAAGGIPEIKAYLNGTHIPNFLRLRAIFVKIVGTIMSVASGMACGQESPLVHIGAGIASGLTRGEKHFRKLLCFKFAQPKKVKTKLLKRFHNDRDRREFICAGAGAGMAAAFGAPVGGVLFVLEEAASHWSPQLIWRVFAAALVATFTLAFIKARENQGDISLAGMLSFGTVQSVEDMKRQVVTEGGTVSVSAVDAPVHWWEIMVFALVGVAGGVLGGLWDLAWNKLGNLRAKRSFTKVMEVLAVSLVTSCVIFFQAYNFPHCRNNGSYTCSGGDKWGQWCAGPNDNTTCSGKHGMCVNASSWICQGGDNHGKVCKGRGDCQWRGGQCMPVPAEEIFGVRLGCPLGQYDELATIYFGTREQSIVRLFTQDAPHQPFGLFSLILAGVTYLILMLFTYGLAIPAGLFMPSVMVGACLGRAVGQVIKNTVDHTVFSGAYALAGAAAMLGGVQRATISLVVIIIEGTANVHFLLPIVVTTCTAKFVGNLFGHEGVYEIGLRRKKLRFLEHEPEWMMDLCTAGDMMSGPPVTVPIVAKVGEVLDILRSCNHNGIPVLSLTDGGDQNVSHRSDNEPQTGKFEGIVLRSQLQHILGARFMKDGDQVSGLWQRVSSRRLEELSLDGDPEMYELMAFTSRKGPSGVKDWEAMQFSDDDRERFINIGAYMNSACYTVLESCPLSRAYKLFRNMGLRHLPVVDIQNHVVGMLARDNFSPEVLHAVSKTYYREKDIHQQYGEGRTPRLCGKEQVARQTSRRTLRAETGSIGGAVYTWQSRLSAVLRLDRSGAV